MVGILYICTNKYSMFWKDFFLSSEKFFLPQKEKKYFVFTDAENLYGQDQANVVKIYQEYLGWPFDTLMRFEMFAAAAHLFKDCDYLFFINANIRFLELVGDEVLPPQAHGGLMAVKHPYFWSSKPSEFTYDRNPASLAFIEEGAGKHYFMGGFNGGLTENYLELIYTLRDHIREDLSNNVIALWHDESHLNRYLLDKNPLVLSPSYGYPQGLQMPFVPKMLILDKIHYGGHNYLRGA